MLDVLLFASAKCSGRCAQNPKLSGMETLDTLFPHAVLHRSTSTGTRGVDMELGMKDCRRAVGDSPQEVQSCCTLLRMLRRAADRGHGDVPEGQRNNSSLLSQTLHSWLHGLTGAWHCTGAAWLAPSRGTASSWLISPCP